jgi:hypothetical protein
MSAMDEAQVVQVWLAGDWKSLSNAECREIARSAAAGERKFQIESRGHAYEIDLDKMTQTNMSTKRPRNMRFTTMMSDPAVGFDGFREGFHQRVPGGKLTPEELQKTWPVQVEGLPCDGKVLLTETVKLVVQHMDLRKKRQIDMMEWNHYWALERDSPSFAMSAELNTKIKEALEKDQQVLGRMQMHFETALGETRSHEGLSTAGLVKACERLVATDKNVIEKQWAQEVLKKHKAGELEHEDDHDLSYFDFLNVMLGRKKFKVELYMYDISDGIAERWSSMVLGKHFDAIWHTGLVVHWPEKSSEFWFGGSLFESEPGSTPFGVPMRKQQLGYTYKLHDEVWSIVARKFAHEFTKDSYDVLTHNCNNFSDKLNMFLMNEHIPEEVRLQPELAMNTVTGTVLRPVLNRWLGTMGDDKSRGKTDSGQEALEMWKSVQQGSLIEFSKDEGGRPQVGEVIRRYEEDCTVLSLDFWKGEGVDYDVPRDRVAKVLRTSSSTCKEIVSTRPTGMAHDAVVLDCHLEPRRSACKAQKEGVVIDKDALAPPDAAEKVGCCVLQ